jgi:hypothetical protein
MDDNKFASLTWQSRWNGAQGVAGLTQDGPDAMACGFFGTVQFRLDKPEDVAAIVNHARQFADMVERAGRGYLGTCDRCGKNPAVRWTSEICQTCSPPVGLCQDCFNVHAAEVAAEAAEIRD